MQYGHVIPRDTSTDDDTVTSLNGDRADVFDAAGLSDGRFDMLGRPARPSITPLSATPARAGQHLIRSFMMRGRRRYDRTRPCLFIRLIKYRSNRGPKQSGLHLVYAES